jgi:hypothetical protein
MEYEFYIADLLTLAAILLPILYFIGFTKYGKAYKTFTLYLVFIAIIQSALFYYALNKENNHFLFNYYFIGQFLLVSIFYYYLLRKKWIWLVTGIIIVGLLVQYIVSPSSFINYNSIGVSVTQSIIVIYALLYYYKSLTGNTIFLIVNTGILFYFLTSILFFASSNLFLNFSNEIQSSINHINNFLYFIFMILIFVEWYKNFRVNTPAN